MNSKLEKKVGDPRKKLPRELTREIPAYDTDVSVGQEIPVTIIKVIDPLTPYYKGTPYYETEARRITTDDAKNTELEEPA